MSFWGSLFGGQNSTLSNTMNAAGANATFANNTGAQDVGTASNFMNTLLSGNSNQVGTLLSPQIAGISNRANQQRQQIGQFGGRSGGTVAAVNKSSDDVVGQIDSMISGLTGSAVSGLGSMGGMLLGQGASDLNSEAGMSEEQMQNYKNSIFGQGITGGLMGGEGIGLGVAGKAAGLSSFF